MPRTTQSAVGKAPPASEVPDPRGTTGTPMVLQTFKTAATSAVVRGSVTASGAQA